LWPTLSATDTDFTIFFTQLSQITPEMQTDEIRPLVLEAVYKQDEYTGEVEDKFVNWISQWQQRVSNEDSDQRLKKMQQANPRYVLRNYLALNAIEAAESGDFSVMEDMMRVLRQPYTEQNDAGQYAVRRPDWATNKPGCTMLTCSS